MRSSLATAAAALIVAMLLAAGCGGGGSEFPAGKWTGKVFGANVGLFEFRSDGRWTFYMGDSLETVEEQASGTYSATKDVLTFESDTSCKTVNVAAEHGTYTWAHHGDQLTLRVRKDTCGNRYATIDGVVLSPVN